MPNIVIPRPNLWKPPAGSVIDFQHPLANGLVGCWPLNEGAGIRVNSAARPAKSIFTVSTTQALADWRAGGVRFAGTQNQYINVTNDNQFDSIVDQFTLEGLVVGTITGSYRSIISFGNQHGAVGSHGSGYMRLNSGNTVTLLRSNVAALVSTARTITDAGVHHFVGTKDGATSRLYIDGVEDSVPGTNSTCNVPSNIYIGADDTNVLFSREWMDGTILKVAAYNRALSPQEVRWLSQEPFAMFRGPEVARRYWVIAGAGIGSSGKRRYGWVI